MVAATLPLTVLMRRKDPLQTRPRHPAQRFVAALASAPFPYDGPTGDTGRPFFDTVDPQTGQRARTTGAGAVLPEAPHFTDDRVLFHAPPGFDPERPFELLVFFHGHHSEIVRTVAGVLDLPGQIDASGRNAVLIAPQLALDAADSSPGKLFGRNGLKALLDEAAEVLAARIAGSTSAAYRRAPVVLAAYSGGYRAVAYCLTRGGLGRRIKGVILLDALYGELPLFARWLFDRWRSAFFISLSGPSTARWQQDLKALLAARRRRPRGRLPATIGPGTQAMIDLSTGHAELPLEGPPRRPLQEILRRLRPSL